MPAGPLAAIDEIVGRALTAPWPAPDDQDRWLRALGFDQGRLIDDRSRVPGHQSFLGSCRGLAGGWHCHDGRLVGIHLMVAGETATEPDLAAAAESLRRDWGARWGPGELRRDPRQGVTEFWPLGERQLDLYWHAPRELGGRRAPGCLQVHVDHAERSRAVERLARGKASR